MVLTNRMVKLCRILAAVEESVSMEKLADIMDLSQRTIYRELDVAKEFCEEYGITIKCTSKKGVSFCGEKTAVQALLLALEKADVQLVDVDDRVNHILVTLLHEENYISLEKLSETLGISMSTIRADIAQAEKISRYSGVQIKRDRGKGVYLEGLQSDKDKLLLNMLLGNMDMDVFYQHLKSDEMEPATQNYEASIFLLNYQYIPYIRKCNEIFYALNHEVETLGFHFGKTYYIEFILLLSFFLRNRKGGKAVYIANSEHQKEPGAVFVHYIIYRLEDVFDIELSVDEKKYIEWIIAICILPHEPAFDKPLDDRVNELIKHVSKQYGSELCFDENTSRQLKMHIKNAMLRINNHITIVNSMLGYIRKEMAEIFRAVDAALKEVYQGVTFPQGEVGYITLYFVLIVEKMKTHRFRILTICSGGMGSSRILASRLEYEIPEIDSVKCISVAELESVNHKEYDLILSTIPIYLPGIEYMRISALLTEKETKQIREKLKNISDENRGAAK